MEYGTLWDLDLPGIQLSRPKWILRESMPAPPPALAVCVTADP